MATEILILIIALAAIFQTVFAFVALSASRKRRRQAQMEVVRLKAIELRSYIHQHIGSEDKQNSVYFEGIARSFANPLNTIIREPHSTGFYDALYFGNVFGVAQWFLGALQGKFRQFSELDDSSLSSNQKAMFGLTERMLGAYLEGLKVQPTLRAIVLRFVLQAAVRIAMLFSKQAQEQVTRFAQKMYSPNVKNDKMYQLFKDSNILSGIQFVGR
jgi:hypothetical protein